jgi:two-component system, NarL family, response regulator DesR
MIRIVIAEDQQMLLGTIGSLLNLEDDMEVVGQASNGEDAMTLVHQLQPDICIMDIDMPRKSGIEAAEELRGVSSKLIIITTFARKGYVNRAVQAGVRGYLLKDSPSELLANSIRSVMAGKHVYDPELMDEETNEELFQLEGNKIVGDEIIQDNTKTGTVKTYFSTIMDKMKLPTG